MKVKIKLYNASYKVEFVNKHDIRPTMEITKGLLIPLLNTLISLKQGINCRTKQKLCSTINSDNLRGDFNK